MAKIKICLDPGHSGYPDPGAVNKNTGLKEADVNLAVSKIIKRKLQLNGYDVIMTRELEEEEESDSLSYRCELANSENCDYFVSIHCNSFDDPKANGFEVWYSEGSMAGEHLAKSIQWQISRMQLTNRGIKSTAQSPLYVLSNTAMPAVLVELAFISNKLEEKMLSSKEGQEIFANAVFNGIANHIENR